MSSNASVTRRSFIAAAGGTAALAAGATLTTAALADEAARFDETYDVVVIGYGAAGGTAAFYAAKNGAKVLLVDSAPEGEEGGYDKFVANRAQDSLLEGMPVSSFTAVLDVDASSPAQVETRWGRAIPARYRDLMPDLDLVDEEPAQFLGCACVSLPYSDDEDKIPGFDRGGTVRTRIADFLLAHGLRQSSAIVAPCVLPVRGKVYTRLYVPVEATGLKGKLELARLG